jgi:flagellar basal body-associated protein FliL
MLQHRTATVLITLMILFLVVLIVLIIAGIWFWGLLEEYVKPKNPTGRKDVVQAFTLIVAGVVGLLGGIVSIASLLQQRALEEKRAQEDAKQSYFEEMGNLLTDENLIDTDREDIRQLAQAQTLTVLARLDGPRTGALVRFLHGAGLINRHKCIVEIANAKLSGAILVRADLYDADLSGANLSGARLFGADLSGAAVTEEQLDTCISRTHATMPNGQKYEDWLKAKNS